MGGKRGSRRPQRREPRYNPHVSSKLPVRNFGGRWKTSDDLSHSVFRMNALDPAIAGVLAARESAVRTQISYAVAAKQLDAARQQGDAVVQLLQAAASMGKSPDRGRQFDALA